MNPDCYICLRPVVYPMGNPGIDGFKPYVHQPGKPHICRGCRTALEWAQRDPPEA